MSSLMPGKQQHTPNTLRSGLGLLNWATNIFTTSVGSKLLVAITGILLSGFVIIHLIGNLKLFGGPDKINAYAEFLKELGPLLWAARIALLTVLLIHLTLVIRLKSRSAWARPQGYYYTKTIQASQSSRTMLMTGIVIFLFILFHLAHYTFGLIEKKEVTDPVTGATVMKNYTELKDAKGRHDVYQMVIHGFTSPVISIFYLLCQLVLMVHLSHGLQSVFQTLGLNSPRIQPTIYWIAHLIAILIVLGNSAIVVAVLFGYVK